MTKTKPFRLNFSLGIAATIILVIAASMASFPGIAWIASYRSSGATARILGASVAGHVKDRLETLFSQAVALAEDVSLSPVLSEGSAAVGRETKTLAYFRRILERNDILYSVYAGFPDGHLIQAVAVRKNASIVSALGAPAETWIAERTISGTAGTRVQKWRFLDSGEKVLKESRTIDPEYDPRTRDWYRSGISAGETQLTDVYTFASSHQPGLTASAPLPDGAGVVGIDLSVESLEGFLASNSPGNSTIYLLTRDKRIIAAADRAGPLESTVSRVMRPLSEIDAKADSMVDLAVRDGTGDALFSDGSLSSGRLFWVSTWVLAGSMSATALIATPMSDFGSGLKTVSAIALALMIVIYLVVLPLYFVMTSRIVKTTKRLSEEAKRIGEMDFSERAPVDSHIREFHELGQSFAEMKNILSQRTAELRRTTSELEHLIEITVYLASERDPEQLMYTILTAARELSGADAGTLFMISKNDAIQHRMFQNKTLDLNLRAPYFTPHDLTEIPLFVGGQPNRSNVVSVAVLDKKTVVIDDIDRDPCFDFSGTRAFDGANGYRSRSFLTIPLKLHDGKTIGALQLINAMSADGEVIPFRGEVVAFEEALSAIAATALYNRELIDGQNLFLNKMVSSLASAIDTKSPYTGGHCRRVPELALMLAEQAAESDDPRLAEFRMAGDDERREFRFAALLHDIGKITTPEYVVDKATKLETIYNRIHEIRARFEILLRDARVSCLESRLAGGDSKTAEKAYLEAYSRLTDDFRFIAECNLGAEFMAPEKIARLETLAAITWQRHFDDRLGLSFEELGRLGDEPARELPATEPLLADRKEHKIPRTHESEHFGKFRGSLEEPVLLYDRGELHNLSVTHGTLNDEERFKINEHIIQTSLILERMEWPATLRHVPKWASTHHESLDGTGYPNGLKDDQLDTFDRILAIADIFEAVTASDRPYRKAKKLSEAIDILAKLRDAKHIDPAIFDLFLTGGTYLAYAEKFLPPAQIDPIDIRMWLSERQNPENA